MDSTILQKIPEEYREIYKRHYSTIRTSDRRGILKDIYHFMIINYNSESLNSYLNTIKSKYEGRRIKFNVAFGFILRNRLTEELRFYHPSNNTMIFDAPRLLHNINDYRKLKEDLEHEDVFEYARTQRPSTQWIVEKIVCMRFDVFKL